MNKIIRIARRLASHNDMVFIFASISFPTSMSPEQALEAARKLLPCDSGSWELEQHEQDGEVQWMVGNLEVPESFYSENPDGFENTDGSVTISFETP